nr:hypothetical protein HmN_000450100 [Hymenolepis microstoma]
MRPSNQLCILNDLNQWKLDSGMHVEQLTSSHAPAFVRLPLMGSSVISPPMYCNRIEWKIKYEDFFGESGVVPESQTTICVTFTVPEESISGRG